MGQHSEKLQEAQAKLNELLEAARKGMIIPIRLPAQIEEVGLLMQQASEEIAAAQPAPSADAAEEAYFIGHAIHELRTPMTSIRGYTDMLGSMGELNDMQKQFLDVVKTNARRMEGLLTDVSTINKIRKGTLKLNPKMDMFKNIAMRIEKELRPQAEAMQRALVMEIPSGLPILNVDGDMFSLALVKLVENGLRYSDEGTGTVTVSAWGEDGMLYVSISDNGIGMSDDDLAQLGTIYFRSENEVVRQYKGSGLGIPIAYGLIAALGGEIRVESALGQGTRFTLRLPGMS